MEQLKDMDEVIIQLNLYYSPKNGDYMMQNFLEIWLLKKLEIAFG